jgi:hypothetical protein
MFLRPWFNFLPMPSVKPPKGYQPMPTETSKKIEQLRKDLNLPLNVNPTLEQLKAAGIELPRPPAPKAPPRRRSPHDPRVIVGDHSLSDFDLVRVCSLGRPLMMVVNERREQIEKHRHIQPLDMQYRDEELARGAVAYILPHGGLSFWPWTAASFKPAEKGDNPRAARIKDLTKGIALALAELERLVTLEENSRE